jgi:RNA polymerase sigma factor
MRKWFENPELPLRRIQAGDSDLREQFIADGIPFIRQAVRKITNKHSVEQEDEFSIALQAFNRAVTHFDTDGDIPFEPYARILIRNSVLNWIREQKKTQNELLMTDSEDGEGADISYRLVSPGTGQIQRDLEFEEAMAEVESRLSLFGLSLKETADTLPKHRDTRLLCLRAARLLNEKTLHESLMRKRHLPTVELSKRSGIPVKTIEKNRIGIIIYSTLLMDGPEGIREYIRAFEEGEK